MNLETFLELSLGQLSEQTRFDKTRWSKYLRGQIISERVLNRLAAKLLMEPHELLHAINLRRKQIKELQDNATNDRLNLVAR